MTTSYQKKSRKGMIAAQKIDTGKKKLSLQLRNNMTYAEKVLWERLRKNRLEGIHFRRQQIIDGVIADFYCHQHGLVIEVDGGIHENQKEYDNVRDSFLRERNLRVLRFANDQVLNELDAVLRDILKECKTPPT